MKRLTRQAIILLFSVGLIVLFLIGFFLGKLDLFGSSDDDVVKEDHDQYRVVLVAENQKITSTYLDSVAAGKTVSSYTECPITIAKGTEMNGYKISQDQSFSKYIELKGPDGKEVLTKSSNQPISHYAYSMLLTGDIQEKTNVKTEEKTYEIVNARITYNRIPIVLLSNENSVYIRNKDKTKEKNMNLQDFIDALKSVKNRNSVISW